MATRRTDLAVRFWRRVRKADGCWEWQGAICPSTGYGKIGMGGRGDGVGYTHRVSYAISIGMIPEGLCVLHRCDNRKCVRPDHLFLGTKSDNAKDMAMKGRSVRGRPGLKGSKHPSAQLSDNAVAHIRYGDLGFAHTPRNIAKHFGLSIHQATRVLGGHAWGHI